MPPVKHRRYQNYLPTEILAAGNDLWQRASGLVSEDVDRSLKDMYRL